MSASSTATVDSTAAYESVATDVRADPGPADQATGAARRVKQLSLGGVMAVWAAAALPMAILAWLVAPALADQLSGAAALPRALLITLAGGLIWQFVLVAYLVRREQGTLRYSVLREALWLRAPCSPKSGRKGGRVWLVVIPLILALGIEEMLPTIAPAAGRDMVEFLNSHAGHALFAGSWGWFAVVVTLALFNTVLGEELLFRGYLLPRMNGVFGRRDWLANGVLFAVYHLHIPWVIPTALLDTFIISYPAKRYRSALIGIVVHSAQSVFIIGAVLALVLKG